MIPEEDPAMMQLDHEFSQVDTLAGKVAIVQDGPRHFVFSLWRPDHRHIRVDWLGSDWNEEDHFRRRQTRFPPRRRGRLEGKSVRCRVPLPSVKDGVVFRKSSIVFWSHARDWSSRNSRWRRRR